ncbi:TPA: 5-formyltetrahydrofolate cyclo-ligase, partial [Candidatus Bathyarchaeota archaeon]|nr:5-formyltetrahydrofolate cyclo-ligase [Candidatus Bathyarchaeota archaeon]
SKALTIRGAFKYGIKCSLKELPPIDLIVTGCVAVSIEGVRVGKGGGFSELEYAVLRELNLINEKTPILTTVHKVQIVDWAPKEIYDLVVDAIVTPQRVIRVENKIKRPKGIFWDLIDEETIRRMPILSELSSLEIPRHNSSSD